MAKSSWHMEIERRANDLLRVYNPTDEDYVIQWDRANGTKRFRVRAKGEAVLIRYIAEKYIREMYEKIASTNADKAVIEENEARIKKGMAEMTKYKDQLSFESKLYSKSAQDQEKLLGSLYVGVENEYGIDDDGIDQKEDAPPQTFGDMLAKVQESKGKTERPPIYENEDASPAPVEAKFSCDYPECDFTTDHHLALAGHKKSHQNKKNQAVSRISQ